MWIKKYLADCMSYASKRALFFLIDGSLYNIVHMGMQ